MAGVRRARVQPVVIAVSVLAGVDGLMALVEQDRGAGNPRFERLTGPEGTPSVVASAGRVAHTVSFGSRHVCGFWRRQAPLPSLAQRLAAPAQENRKDASVRKVTLLLAAMVVLAVAGVARAAAPPDPNTLVFTTLSNISLNSVPGTQLVVAPGANVTISADWSDSHPDDCPGCIDFLAVGWSGQGAGRVHREFRWYRGERIRGSQPRARADDPRHLQHRGPLRTRVRPRPVLGYRGLTTTTQSLRRWSFSPHCDGPVQGRRMARTLRACSRTRATVSATSPPRARTRPASKRSVTG